MIKNLKTNKKLNKIKNTHQPCVRFSGVCDLFYLGFEFIFVISFFIQITKN